MWLKDLQPIWWGTRVLRMQWLDYCGLGPAWTCNFNSNHRKNSVIINSALTTMSSRSPTMYNPSALGVEATCVLSKLPRLGIFYYGFCFLSTTKSRSWPLPHMWERSLEVTSKRHLHLNCETSIFVLPEELRGSTSPSKCRETNRAKWLVSLSWTASKLRRSCWHHRLTD